MGRGGVGVEVNRFEVYLVNLDPTIGSEIKKTRPCLVISPDEMNSHIRTVITAPMTTKGRSYPTRVSCRFKGKSGQIVLDQIRTIDKTRFVKRLGRIDRRTADSVLSILAEMFAP
jgi:mRNA interferase MazF